MSNRQHVRYALVVAGVALCVWLLSFLIPNEYAAQAKISDEYKTTDLLIGLNTINVMMRDMNVDAGNEGTDDIEVYAKYLTSDDFAHQMAKVPIRKYRQDYQHYLEDNSPHYFWDDATIEERIREHIRYNISLKTQAIDIQATDQDGEVAAEVLQHVLVFLKQEIERFRTERALKNQENATTNRRLASEAYHAAARRYRQYVDSHERPKSDYVSSRIDALQKDMNMRYELYRKAAEAAIRADYLVKKENTSFFVVKTYNLSQSPIAPCRWAYALVAGLLALLGCLFHRRMALLRESGSHPTLDFGDWFSPWTITIGIWTLVLGLYYLLDTELYPLKEQFYYCFFIWMSVFLVTSLVTYHLTEGTPEPVSMKGHMTFHKPLFTFFFVISLIITPLYVYRVLQIVMMFSTEDLMSNIRTLSIYGEGQGFLNYSNVINQSLLVVALWAHPKVRMWQIVVIVLACLLNSLAIMEKGGIFFVFFCVVFVLFEKKVIRLRSIAIAGLLLIGFFYLFNLARSGEDSDYQKNETLLDFFAMYALSSPVAFGHLLQDITPQFGPNTFETVYLFLERFGVKDIVVKDKLQEFMWVPIPTNVYTIFQPFFVDFGYKGVAFFAAFYGVVSGWLYRLFRSGSSMGCCLYTYMAEVLVLQFYQENVFLSMVFVLQFVFFIILFTQQKVKLTFNNIPAWSK